MEKKIKEIFEEHGGVMRTSQLSKYGIHYRNLKKLLDDGIVAQVHRGYYQYQDEQAFSDMPVIVKMFPDAIICMESALDYYGYTERTPSAWHIAVDSRSNRKKYQIDYPPIKAHFIVQERLVIGVEQVEIDGVQVSIYNRDRTICDCLLNRNKMDAEVFNYAIRIYLQDEKKERARLAEYAKKLHVEKKVREVLAAWL